MKTIKTEDFVFDKITYTIKAWQSARDYVVQVFQGEFPLRCQFVLDTVQAEDMQIYYSANPIDMLMKRMRRFVEESKLIEIEKRKRKS
jgi:hypothetical protein